MIKKNLLEKEIPIYVMQRLEIFAFVFGFIGLVIGIFSLKEQIVEMKAQNIIQKEETVLRSFELIHTAKIINSQGNIGQVEAINNLIHMGVSLEKFDFSELFLEGVNFVDVNLSRASFNKSLLRGVNFSGANLQNAIFSDLNLNSVLLPKLNTSGLSLYNVEFDLRSPTTTMFDFNSKSVLFGGLDFFNVDLDHSHSNYLRFRAAGSDISFSTMRSAKFYNLQAPFSNFVAVDMSNSNFKEAVFSGSTFSNGYCSESSDDNCEPYTNISNIDFTGADLTGVIFSEDILFGNNKEMFSNACYTKKGIEFVFVQLDCTKSSKPMSGISVLVTGKPTIPQNFTPVKDCTTNNTSPTIIKEYFFPAIHNDETDFIKNIMSYAKERNYTIKTMAVDKNNYCEKGGCICP